MIYITFDGRGSKTYMPGETLAGSYRFENIGSEVQAVEVSFLWFTTGKGSEDFGVHYFKRSDIAQGDWIDPRNPGRFSAVLPKTPLTYHGNIVKIHWVVRVRVFLPDGQELVEDSSFRLGKLLDVRMLSQQE